MDDRAAPTPETPLSEIAPPSPDKIVRLAILFEGGLFLLACAIGPFLQIPPWRQIRGSAADVAWGLAATVPMLVGLVVIRRIRGGPLGRLNHVVDEFLVPLFARCMVLQLALISIVAGVGEEFLFRGVIQPVVIGWLGTTAGLLITSAVFGILHAVTVSYAVLATLVGVYLGWLALATGNLVAPIVAHALYDFAALVYLTRSIPPRQSEIDSIPSDIPV